MTTQPQHTVPVFFVNTCHLAGVLTKGQPDNIQSFHITNGKGQFLIWIESANEYLLKEYDELEDGSFISVNVGIHQFPNGHYLFAEDFNSPQASASGICIRVNEPKEVNGRNVVNFAIAQSVSKDDNGTIIDCAYWYKENPNKANAIVAKLRVGAFLAVAGRMKVGSYAKEGQEIPTVSIDCRHVASPKASTSGVMPMTKPSFTVGKPPAVTAPVAGPAIDF